MITGLRFQGQHINMNSKYEMSRALELLGVGTEAVTEGKIRLSNITPTMEEVNLAPASDEAKAILFRQLFLYFLSSCFFSNNRLVINHEFVQFLEQIEEVGSYDWGAMTYAAFLAGMRRKVTGEMGAFTGFWPFLLGTFSQGPFAGVLPVLLPLPTSQILLLLVASWITLMRPR
ncbi:hypothetical protein F0562_017336 [Nyssa sinensis]|uniref:Aminotransferase-like plant mobile domain-containing protein n=1 Tax=Nyssa sinensis TaxID=561372 RepID=A0A5J4ZGQ4_9ASTE|nr:hypothetical protein F0562_017336 [Nyssa sinensis]